MIFGWRKDESGTNGPAPFQPQPEKAAKFFEHARTVAGTGNHEYALRLFAGGLKFDPGNLAAHQTMYETAIQFFQGEGKPATNKDLKTIEGSGPVHAMVVAEYVWMRDLNNVTAALRLLEAAGKAEQPAFGQWLAPKMLNMLRKAMEKKPQKKVWVQAIEYFSSVEAWNEAFACGEEAQRARCLQMGVAPERVLRNADLAPGKNIVFLASGVTKGDLLDGVRFFGNGVRVSSVSMTYTSRRVRFIESVYMLEPKASDEVEDKVVLAKQAAARTWCARASAHAAGYGGKQWRYALIPHNVINESMSLRWLVEQFGVK